jgi:cyclophilin family peptidyl-prolyl cis-trans isomerase
MFINFGENANLDGMGFSPFAKVVSGMDVVNKIYKCGENPDQGQIQEQGNAYLKESFPQLTYITSASVVGAHTAAKPAVKADKTHLQSHTGGMANVLKMNHHHQKA